MPIEAEIIENLFITTGVYLLDDLRTGQRGPERKESKYVKTGNGGRSRAESALKFKPFEAATEEMEGRGRPTHLSY